MTPVNRHRPRVVFFHRRPDPSVHHSIEEYFAGIRAELTGEIDARVRVAPFASRGVLRRVATIVDAPFHQGDVNHVTGDIHFATYLLRHRRTMLTVHDCLSLEAMRGLRRALFKALWFDLPCRCSATITVNSEATRSAVMRHTGIQAERIHVIPVFVSTEFRKTQKVLNLATPRVLQIGTTKNKNLDRVIEALRGQQCFLDIVGDITGAQRSRLESFGIPFRQASRIHTAEVIARYEACDVVMFASTAEGFGMPIVEANVVGRPVITGNTTSMPEIAGDAACIVDSTDVEAIRAGLDRLRRERGYAEHLIERGWRNQERFQRGAIASRYLALYRDMTDT